MIFCNQCGSGLADGLNFCTECGAGMPVANPEPQATLRINAVGAGAGDPSAPALTPAPAIAGEPAHAPHDFGYRQTPVAAAAASPNVNGKLILGIIGGVAVFFIVIVVLIANSGTKPSGYRSTNASSTSNMTLLLQDAINSGRLVTLSSDDAYTLYFKLRETDPQNSTLTNVKQQVLPKLRSMGDDIFRTSASIQWKRLTERDWNIAKRVYEWGHVLEPADKTLEARLKYAGAEIARLQEDRYNAERGLKEAIQLDSSWALPQFSLGLLYMRRDKSEAYDSPQNRGRIAASYYQRAINLKPDWELPYMSMGTAYFLQKDYDTAEMWYHKAIEMNPNWGGPHAWMGAIYEKKGSCSAAIYEYEKAIQLEPDGYSFDVTETQNKINQIRANCNS